MNTEDIETVQNPLGNINGQENSVCNQINELQSPLETPEIESDDEKKRIKIPIMIGDRHVATLVEMTDTDQTTDADFTPSQEISSTDIEFTPAKEKQPTNYVQEDEAMECDEKADSKPISESFIDRNVVELGRCSWRGSSKNQRYLKGCLWSPDGTCLLTTVNGDGMHVFEMPRDLYNAESVSSERPLDCLQSVVNIKEGGIVYDYCWFPFMNSNDPATCW